MKKIISRTKIDDSGIFFSDQVNMNRHLVICITGEKTKEVAGMMYTIYPSCHKYHLNYTDGSFSDLYNSIEELIEKLSKTHEFYVIDRK